MELTDADIDDMIQALDTAEPEPGHLGFVPDVLPVVSLPPEFSFEPDSNTLTTGTTRAPP